MSKFLRHAPLSDEERTRRAAAVTVAEASAPRRLICPDCHTGYKEGERHACADRPEGIYHGLTGAEDVQYGGGEKGQEATRGGQGRDPEVRGAMRELPSSPHSETGGEWRTETGFPRAAEPGAVGVQPAAPPPLPVPPPDDAWNLPRIIRDGAPVDRWVKTEHGLSRWRPIVDSWRIEELPQGGRLIEISGSRPLRADAEQASHLAWLLMPKEWRLHLSGRMDEALAEPRR